MALYEIPLTKGNQKFTVKLNKEFLKLQLIYRLEHWYLDVLDSSETALISGLALNVGPNLLGQYQHILEGSIYVTNANIDESQGFNDLGGNIRLYWSDLT